MKDIGSLSELVNVIYRPKHSKNFATLGIKTTEAKHRKWYTRKLVTYCKNRS